MHPVKNILNRLRWDAKESPENYVITYRHRGAPGDVKHISASRIVNLGKSYFTIQESGASEESVIPFHRILEIRKVEDGKVIWVGRKRSLDA